MAFVGPSACAWQRWLPGVSVWLCGCGARYFRTQPATEPGRKYAQSMGSGSACRSRSTHRSPKVAELVLFQVLPRVVVLILPFKRGQPARLLARPVKAEPHLGFAAGGGGSGGSRGSSLDREYVTLPNLRSSPSSSSRSTPRAWRLETAAIALLSRASGVQRGHAAKYLLAYTKPDGAGQLIIAAAKLQGAIFFRPLSRKGPAKCSTCTKKHNVGAGARATSGDAAHAACDWRCP